MDSRNGVNDPDWLKTSLITFTISCYRLPLINIRKTRYDDNDETHTGQRYPENRS